MRYLITGANGFLGRRVVESLLALGKKSDKLRCLVRANSSTNGLDQLPVEVFRGSLDNESDIRAMLEDIDCIVHLAASRGGSPMGMFLETVVSTEKLITLANHANVQKFVFCSSFSVYGSSQLANGAVFNEECPLEPHPEKRDPYAWCKYHQEKVVREMLSDEIEVAIIRPGVIYGDDQGLLSPRVGMQLPGLPVFLKIGGKARIPLVHVSNCGEMIALAASTDVAGHAVFNAVDDYSPTQQEYLALYENVIQPVPKKLPMPYPVFYAFSAVYDLVHRLSRGNFPAIFSTYKTRTMYRRFEYSNQRAKTQLNWRPAKSLEHGLSESASFIRERLVE